MTKKLSPRDITFGTQILTTPNLSELGIPIPLSYIARIEQHALTTGTWVDAGDPLVTYHFDQFDSYDKPSSWFFWLKDKQHVKSFTLHSPVAGLLIDVTSTSIRENHWNSHGIGYLSLIEDRLVLPSLLIAENKEITQNANYDLANFSHSITNYPTFSTL